MMQVLRDMFMLGRFLRVMKTIVHTKIKDMLNKPKVAIFSDLHLGIYGNSTDWHDIALKWADWIVKDLKKNNIKDILFLGDFFHNRSEISVLTTHVASEIISKFKDFNMIMVIGNHDCFYKNRADIHSLGMLKGHDNLTIVDECLKIESFGKSLLFVPWFVDVPVGKYDYIFGHFEIVSFKMNNFKICDHGLQPSALLKGMTDHVFSGHFHNRHSKEYKEGSIHYVGNTFPMDFSDVGNTRGYHILDVESGEIEFFENPISPKFVKILLSEIEQVESSTIKGNIVKMIIDVDMDDPEIEKNKNHVRNMKPHQFIAELNVSSKNIDNVEVIDSIDISDQLEEFRKQLKLEKLQDERVGGIIKELYANNS